MCNCDKCQAQQNEMASKGRPNNTFVGRGGSMLKPKNSFIPNINSTTKGVPPPTPTDYGMEIRGRICLTLDNFLFDSHKIPAASGASLLKKVAKTIFCLSEDIDYIKVVGHADIKGREGYNQQLGMRRAQAVKSFLQDCLKRLEWLEKDLSRNIKIEVQSMGESQATKGTDEKNRRVEIEIAYRPAPQSKLPHCASDIIPEPTPPDSPCPTCPVCDNIIPTPNPQQNNQFHVSGQVDFNGKNKPNKGLFGNLTGQFDYNKGGRPTGSISGDLNFNTKGNKSNRGISGNVKGQMNFGKGGQQKKQVSKEISVLSEILNEAEVY
jgi:outer membrane protein OmpA-like peptidoglycan-associated protein